MKSNPIFVVAFGFVVSTMANAAPLQGQTPEDSVVAAVQVFFDAMTSRDAAAARQVLVMDGQYHRVRQTQGQTSVQRSTFEEYVTTLSGDARSLLERMWEPTVMLHGPIAVVWTNYDFHRDGTFSHCGVDAFTLIRTDGGWKISGILYTVEFENCPPNPLGPPTGL